MPIKAKLTELEKNLIELIEDYESKKDLASTSKVSE
jgi:hypothetical protein